MNVLQTLKDGLASIWQIFGAVPGAVLVPVTYVRVARAPYVPGGRVVVTETEYSIPRIALIDYDLAANPRTDIAVSDKQAIIRASDLTFRPSLDDRIREADGTEWTVRAVSGFSEIYHDLQVRRR